MIVGGLVTALRIVLPIIIALCADAADNSSSVGIIGGAEAPTAIFVSSKVLGCWPVAIIGVGLVAVAVGIVLYIVGKRKSK